MSPRQLSIPRLPPSRRRCRHTVFPPPAAALSSASNCPASPHNQIQNSPTPDESCLSACIRRKSRLGFRLRPDRGNLFFARPGNSHLAGNPTIARDASNPLLLRNSANSAPSSAGLSSECSAGYAKVAARLTTRRSPDDCACATTAWRSPMASPMIADPNFKKSSQAAVDTHSAAGPLLAAAMSKYPAPMASPVP